MREKTIMRPSVMHYSIRGSSLSACVLRVALTHTACYHPEQRPASAAQGRRRLWV